MIINNNKERVKGFRKNEELENYLKDINSLMAVSEKIALEDVRLYTQPIIFVVGPPRSGTTLMTQWLASTGQFAYATNMMSRFYQAPIIAAKIQRLLTEEKYNYRNELCDIKYESSYNSVYGKTQGALEPNEFWYLWRRFVPDDACYYTDEQLYNNTDIELMKKEFYGIADEFGMPFVIKALNCNFNIGFLDKIFPKALFIYIIRNYDNNIDSIINTRRRFYNDESKWYSFVVPEYDEIIKISDPEVQVRKQVESIHKGIKSGLQSVTEEKKLVVHYEDFCENPEEIYKQIVNKLRLQGFDIDTNYIGVNNFAVR